MATTVFAAEIVLNDHASPVTANSTVGLFNVNSSLAANAASGQKDITVDDGTKFQSSDVITVKDDNASETATINYIVGNILTVWENLANSYVDVADNGIVHGNSVFRWIQNTVSGVSNWKEDVLAVGGIGVFTRSIDLKRGGQYQRPGYGLNQRHELHKQYYPFLQGIER